MSNLIWMDLEMSGLNPDKDKILEMASIITDDKLNIVAVGPEFVIGHDSSLFLEMDEWNQTHHTQSGLWDRVINSKVTLSEAEEKTLLFFQQHAQTKTSPLCGNSIWQDRRFLAKYTCKLNEFMHYRNVDVSSIKELVLRWYEGHPQLPFRKNNKHRAIDDIVESINELKHYRKIFFIK